MNITDIFKENDKPMSLSEQRLYEAEQRKWDLGLENSDPYLSEEKYNGVNAKIAGDSYYNPDECVKHAMIEFQTQGEQAIKAVKVRREGQGQFMCTEKDIADIKAQFPEGKRNVAGPGPLKIMRMRRIKKWCGAICCFDVEESQIGYFNEKRKVYTLNDVKVFFYHKNSDGIGAEIILKNKFMRRRRRAGKSKEIKSTSIENVDPTKSTEKFEEISMTKQEREKLSYSEKYKKLKNAENIIIKNEKVLLDKINSIKIPDSSLLNGSKYNQRTKNCKYKLKINESSTNKNKFIWNESFKINKGKTTKYSYNETMFVSREYPMMVHFGSEDRDDKDQEQNFSIRIYGKKDKYKEATSIAKGEFFKNYENAICNALQDTINSLIKSDDSGITVNIVNKSGYRFKYRGIKDENYFSNPWSYFTNDYYFGFDISLSCVFIEDEFNNTKIVVEKGSDTVMKYLWDSYTTIVSILKNIKSKNSVDVDYLRISKNDFISVFRPMVNEYLKKRKNTNSINTSDLLKFINSKEDLNTVGLYFKNANYDISDLKKIINQYKQHFEISIISNYRNEVILDIYPKTNIINL